MKFLRRLQEYFSFTKNEQKILLFLSIVFLAGVAIKIYKAYVTTDGTPPFDYRQSDSMFTERSKELLNDSLPSRLRSIGSKKININTASKNELMELPGIGEAMADRILLYREEKGSFKSIAEMKKVKGVGEKKFEKLKPFIEAQ